MTKEFNVEFEKIELDSDNSSVMIKIKEIDGESIILHFTNSPRVRLLHDMQNNIYNTRQQYKQYMRKVAQEEENREIDMRRKINESAIDKQNKDILKVLSKGTKYEDEKI